MPPRRQSPQTETHDLARDQLTSEPDSEAAPVAPPRANYLAVAKKLRTKLKNIDKREADYIANARERYQLERDRLMNAAGDRVKAILRAADEEEDEET